MLLAKENLQTVGSAFDDIGFDFCQRRKDVLMMSADLAQYCDLYKVTKDLPDQYVEVGMAEQNLVGVAAGLAKAGLVPVTTTFGSYASRRCFDQMVICMGTSKNTGICIGFTPGITSPAPIHHQGTEDLGMLRGAPCDRDRHDGCDGLCPGARCGLRHARSCLHARSSRNNATMARP